MTCPKCGNQLNDGAVFCPKCGYKVENNTANNISNQPIANNTAVNTVAAENVKKKPKTWKTVLIAVAATVVAGFAGLMALGSKSTNTSTQNVTTSEEVSDTQQEEGSNTLETSDAEALNELLVYIDQAEELVEETYNNVKALFDSEEEGRFRKAADILADSLSDLSDLRKQADAVSGIGADLKNVMTEYFNMANDSLKAFYEGQNFFADYLDLYGSVLVYAPKAADYDSIPEYHTALSAWYEAAKEGCEAVDSCPSWLESEWEKYGEILDLNTSILNKLKEAAKYGDNLRMASVLNMSNRYDIVEELQYNEFIKRVSSQREFFQRQRSLASSLAEEMHAYAELSEGERSGYEFENVFTDKFLHGYDAVDTIYPSLYNTYDAFVILNIGCISGNRKIVVEAEIPGFTQNYKESFTLNSGYRTIYIKPPALTGDLNLSSAKDAQMNVSLYESDGTTLIEAKTFPITIKSKNDVEWYTDEYGFATQDNILCFLTPESDAIAELKRVAVDEIAGMTGGNMEIFPGYQTLSSDPDSYLSNPYAITYLQAAGIMRALNEMGVRYVLDGYSLSGSHQYVRMPDEVIEKHEGLCIETSLVVASALQSADMHAFLVFPPGHAQVAVEIWKGSGEYLLIETTAVADKENSREIYINGANELIQGYKPSGPISYKNADEWADYLKNDVEYIIDCDDSRVLGLTPFVN